MSNQNFQSHRDTGFVLPYVLIVIMMLAISGAFVANRLTETGRLMQSIDISADVEMAFAMAEAQAKFVLLPAAPVDRAMNLSKNPTEASINDILGITVDQNGTDDLWHVNGEMRIVETPIGAIYVELRDVTGLLPLNSAPADEIIPVLTALGADGGQAVKLATALEDYRDFDNLRRFQGAERADYRLRGLRPPTNSPLRDYGELNHVMRWPEFLASIDMFELKAMTTLSEATGQLNLNFAPSQIKSLLQDIKDKKLEAPQSDVFSVYSTYNLRPSRRLRLTFTYVSAQDVVWQRVIELEKRFNNPLKPFRRYWIYDRSTSDQFTRPDELKNVINAPSDSL